MQLDLFVIERYFFRPLRQTTSWEKQKNTVSVVPIITHHRAMSCDSDNSSHGNEELSNDIETGNWSSDCSNSDDEDHNSPVCKIYFFYASGVST